MPERRLSVVTNIGAAFEPSVDTERPTLKLHDIVGLATVKQTLGEIITKARSVNGRGAWLGGALLYGPPNCGKHFSARVIAGELDAPLHTVNLAAATPLPSLLEQLRPVLEANERSVVFLEHVDAVPGHVDQHAGALLSQVVPMLDGLAAHNSSIVLGSATYPWSVSPLIARPGRLARALLVLPPDAPARRTYLLQALADADADQELVWLVGHTEGYSFGDLAALLDAARADGDEGAPLSHVALRHARQASAPTSAEWLTTAGHHALINESSGLYDDLLAYFRNREKS